MGKVIQPGYTTKGGTVNILSDANYEHLDPVNNYVTNSVEFGRLIYRTLTFVNDAPGKTPKVEPDLAAKLGTPSADKKTWTYELRTGLKYEDGTPITSKDIKYAVERSFATDLYKDGATYMTDLLAPSGYAGPYKDPTKDLTSVDASDPNKIVFKFAAPTPDSDWLMTTSRITTSTRCRPARTRSRTTRQTSRSRSSATPTGIRRVTPTAPRCRTASSRPSGSTYRRSASG
jgi:peptide/nickel transport system substrate-binding protein